MRLNELSPAAGSSPKKKRIARGPGSGKGKTAGRGIKGQKSRSGVAIKGYEGGQMPLYQRLPKRGFNKPNRKSFAVVNLALIEKFIAEGKLDASAPITEDVLVASGLVRRKLDGVRVLAKTAPVRDDEGILSLDAKGKLQTVAFASKVELQVTGASKAAVAAVEAAGGSITLADSSAKSAEAEA
ncbi:MAG: 50S ribosomal protein L15 [Oceanicola sp.]|jgi:large subunit ribosomal protein L15|nr:50S ribosomal protein L15 [Oceanicola sp.]